MLKKMNLFENDKKVGSRVLEYIRTQLNKSYAELSNEHGFDWRKAESNEVILSEDCIRDVYTCISLNKNDLGKAIFGTDEGFFHGSKSGIRGNISLRAGRKKIDFGQGFYVGDNIMQVSTLCAAAQKPVIYKCSIDFTDLKVYTFTSSENWALFIAVNRDIITRDINARLYDYYKHLCDGYDIIVGPIADDSLSISFYRYCDRNSSLTIGDLVRVLSMVKLGNQYVFKTEKALKQLTINDSFELVGNDKLFFDTISKDNYSYGKLASTMLGRVNKGKTFKQILKEWK